MPPKQKAPKGRASNSKTSNIISDPRFANIHTDPRFRLPSRKQTRVKLDKRFARMLEDEDFSRKATIDRYGRKIGKEQGRKELERLYRVGDEDEDEEAKEEKVGRDEAEEESDEPDDDDVVQRELRRVDRAYDPAREGGFSTSEDEASSSEEDGEDESEAATEDADMVTLAAPGPAPREADVPLGDVSARLAAVNLDWDNIGAVDLLAVAQSFAPPDGAVLSVAVYPSDFGRERLEREEVEGPPREIFGQDKGEKNDRNGAGSESEDEDDGADEQDVQGAEDYSSTALRAYQLSRLRYYYAVITCSSASCAKALYDAMDGREYLSSANFFDLRFVPDSVSLKEDTPRDVCEKGQVPEGYRPNEFITDALQHSSVKLTWDADDMRRKEVQKRAFKAARGEEVEEDLRAYLGSSDSGDDEKDHGVQNSGHGRTEKNAPPDGKKQAKASALRAMLGLSADPQPQSKRKGEKDIGDMQITFSSALANYDGDKKKSVFENEPEETTIQKYVRKERERKARRRERARARRPGLDAGKEFRKHDALTEPDGPGSDADPFDDPFFTDPVGASRAAEKAARKAEQARRRDEEAAHKKKRETERKELELLMGEDVDASGTGVEEGAARHFDMREVMKAEKERRRRGKKGKKGGKEGQQHEDKKEGEKRDGFKINVKDPRFARLYDSHEFAIDPTNPRFRETEAMRELLEEGRRKRKVVEEREGVDKMDGRGEEKSKKAKVGERTGTTAADGDNLKRLVEKVKGGTR
ncbi:hypothetical protein BDY21DRAFT_282910 [Lineolata rhizophorae]|uniref:Uncharacterized protein n=1 Tax=Lineolata rhizophorae TaxID=578093 RepID=A0A6A6P5I7_9PEZI|nr:hypothetical protein BDY21DRAFT_282910 [Lineolata rhizophorae]